MRFIRSAQTSMVCFTLVISSALFGCGVQSSPKPPATQGNHQTSNLTGGPATASVDPHLYSVCQKIVTDVSNSLAKNRNQTFNKLLQSIDAVGQSSAPGTPNAVLYADAETVVSMDEGINGEGAPANAYTKIQTAIKDMRAHLAQYKSVVKKRST